MSFTQLKVIIARHRLWGSQEPKQATEKTNQAEINIFSVASGHLYERFLSIMILSVLRHTKSTVKFWFIENFLSPSFMVSIRAHGYFVNFFFFFPFCNFMLCTLMNYVVNIGLYSAHGCGV